MLRKINLGTAVQAVAIGMLLVGIAVVSFSVYTEFQSSSYAVQVDNESSSVNGAFGIVNHHTVSNAVP